MQSINRYVAPDTIIGVLWVTMGAAIIVVVHDYPEGSAAYPAFLGVLLCLLGGYQVARHLRLAAAKGVADSSRVQGIAAEIFDPDEDDAEFGDPADTERLPASSSLIFVTLLLLFVASLRFFMFPASAALFGLMLLRLVYGYTWRAAVMWAVVGAGISSLVFNQLGVALPGLSR